MTQPQPVALDHLDLLTRAQGEFLATIAHVDPRTRIPWCGRWRVRDLVVHLGRIHHWAAGQAARRQETPLGRGPFVLDELYATHAAELRDTLARLGDAPAWTLVGDGPASWWRRRQLHETLVHLWDLRASSGLDVDVEPDVWADTVDEVVTVMQPRQEAMGRMAPLPAPVRLVATDTGRSWLLGAAPVAAAGAAPGTPSAVQVSGTAMQLALLVWRRLGPDAVAVDGPRAALDHALAQSLTP